MTTPKKRGPKPKISMFRDHPKFETRIINQIHAEAVEEITVLDILQGMGGVATTEQLKREIPTLTKVTIDQALKRQREAGNVKLGWDKCKLVWELI